MRNSVNGTLGVLAAAAMLAAVSLDANAALIKSYDFDAGLSDTLGNGVDLTASGGAVSGGRYGFAANQGLRLTDALPSTTDYGIEIRVRIEGSLGGFKKLVDLDDLGSDTGLYLVNNGIDFFPFRIQIGNVLPNTDFTVGLARAGGSIELFVDGALLFTAPDAGRAVSASNVLNFFEDDFITGQRESFSGSADFIRIHEDSSTFGTQPPSATALEPGTLALLALAVIGFGFMRRLKV